MHNESLSFGAILLLAVAFIIYFVPTIVSQWRLHHNATAISILNLVLGWTFLGWVVALIWSFSAVAKPAVAKPAEPVKDDKYSALERLGSLKDKGLISDQEFDQEKAKILQS